MSRTAVVGALLALGLAAVVAEAQEAASVGRTNAGRLVGGAELPERGEGFHFETNRGNPTARHGTPELVGALVRAAAAVRAAHPGSDLAIHDLSLPGGGPISGHGSHQSGRDVDVAYYARGADGAPLDPTSSRWFVRSGAARGEPTARFDGPRNWAFVRALLADEEIRVQYVFMAPHLQRMLLEAAEGDALAGEAASVLRTPRGRRVDPHADHLHLRIQCPPDDVAHGCEER